MAASIRLILLAAGTSSRMGSRDKLTLPLGAGTVLERSVMAAVDAAVGQVIVVTGSDPYGANLERYPVRVVENAAYEEGMASSIRAGVGAEGGAPTAYGIMLADMPFVRPSTIAHLAEQASRDVIVVPSFDGVPGHPVFFGSSFATELAALQGDVGARSVVEAHARKVILAQVDDPGIVRDIDTEEAYRRASEEIGGA